MSPQPGTPVILLLRKQWVLAPTHPASPRGLSYFRVRSPGRRIAPCPPGVARPRDSFPEHVGHSETFSQRPSPDAASLPHTVPPGVVCVSGTDTEHTRRLAVFLSMKVTLTGACSPGLGRELEAGPRGHEVAVTF